LSNGVPEAGKYLIHITLKGANEAENLDAHMSFDFPFVRLFGVR
jgi:hypothetical protein